MLSGDGILSVEVDGKGLASEEGVEDASIVDVIFAIQKDPRSDVRVVYPILANCLASCLRIAPALPKRRGKARRTQVSLESSLCIHLLLRLR